MWDVVVAATGWLGAEDAHTSLLPQASMLENPEKFVDAGAGWAWGAAGGAGDDRLNAELIGGDATGAGAGLGAAAGAEGIERSKRSPNPDDEAAGCDGAGDEKAEKSPSPPDGLVVRFCAGVWYVGGDLGLESKKLPPPPNIFEDDVVGGDFVLEKLSRPEKGEGLGAGCAAWLNDRPLKASFNPPNADC